jgi:oligopeptidase A
MHDNPLLDLSGLPRFRDIRAEHVRPAVDDVLAAARARIATLTGAAAPGGPGYDAFAGELEDAVDRINRAWSPVAHLHAVADNDALRAAYNDCLPKISEFFTEFGQNARLFAGYQALGVAADPAIGEVERKVIADAIRDFRLAGVELPEAARGRFAAIVRELSTLGARFSENLLDATGAWRRPLGEAEAAGLPEGARAMARAAAAARGEQGMVLTLHQPAYQAVMTHAESAALRREVHFAHATRASEIGPQAGRHDNTPLIDQILRLRHEQAGLLGFDSYAALSLATKMAPSAARVREFLDALAAKSLPRARTELAELADFAAASLGIRTLSPWDYAFASERLRVERHAISQEALRPYFPLPQVLHGLFTIIERLFGVAVRERGGVDVWHADVRCFDLVRGGSVIGTFFLDPYAREHKNGGAWMDGCRVRRRLAAGMQQPAAYLVCNFTPPAAAGRPALLTHDDVQTLFHEAGHGLHHLLTRVERAPVSGINGVPWDAVELPSQFLENWCFEPEGIALVARHHETGEGLPAQMLERLLAARNFQSAMQMVRQLEFSLFDLQLHDGYRDEAGFVRRTLAEVRARVAVVDYPDYNRFENSFSHIFAGGYAAGYYSYKWAEVLSADAFAAFEEEGIFNRRTGQRFLECILERGGAVDPMQAFRAFRGREPSEAALLRHRGIAA